MSMFFLYVSKNGNLVSFKLLGPKMVSFSVSKSAQSTTSTGASHPNPSLRYLFVFLPHQCPILTQIQIPVRTQRAAVAVPFGVVQILDR